MLTRTSRTFAVAIPCLPEPLGQQVTIAYLLFRVVDTIEDGPHLNRDEKLKALDELHQLLDAKPGSETGIALPRSPCDNTDYLELLAALPRVLRQTAEFPPAIRTLVIRSVQKSLGGMKQFIAAGTAAGRIELRTLPGLRQYCYFVAGVVGEMLTELFLAASPELEPIRMGLHPRARYFGEGLQLVNILKDSAEDRRLGHQFEPHDTCRTKLFELAREDLHKADQYVTALRQSAAHAGIVAFTEFPLQLAGRTLECVERSGPGSKVPRSDVLQILAEMRAAAGLTPGATAPPSIGSSRKTTSAR